MHLSPIKGAFPHKDQHDRTAPAKVGENIQRGTVIRINDEGEFVVAEDASVYPMYLALQRYSDLQATMAGLYTVGNGKVQEFPYKPGQFPRAGRATATQPAISGIHMDDGDVWETDEFDATANWGSATFNAKLTVKGGKITLAESDDDGVVGFLVKAPYTRYANDAVAVEGMMTGANIQVIQFQCGK